MGILFGSDGDILFLVESFPLICDGIVRGDRGKIAVFLVNRRAVGDWVGPLVVKVVGIVFLVNRLFV